MHSVLTTPQWLKSSYSTGQGACVEIAPNFTPTLPLRDSKDPNGPALVFPVASFSAFVSALKADSLTTI
ncbi:DUF397 domain-containing protein [Kitasatospora viridis]|uniref:Uncharacterized protein DUF397 n=1 Tax=Kitasatospora viridis TaxID=281105 RepID=A0A561UDC2_9ACTN|nr:DUF397 domain-containing protein [Kitasatospora viridis]TWF97372.1 uncharacterized protein DUF397 [Kitasatospora viridis]